MIKLGVSVWGEWMPLLGTGCVFLEGAECVFCLPLK